MTRRMITFLMTVAAAAVMAIGASSAPAKQGADDPAGHVRHTGADDGAKAHKKAKKCKRARHARHASTAKHTKKCKKARHGKRRGRGADDPANHDAGDDNGGDRPAGTTDDPANHDAGDDGRRGRGGDDA